MFSIAFGISILLEPKHNIEIFRNSTLLYEVHRSFIIGRCDKREVLCIS